MYLFKKILMIKIQIPGALLWGLEAPEGQMPRANY